MDYEEFEKMFNKAFKDSGPKLPNRIDSCPPTPRRQGDFCEELVEADYAEDFEMNDLLIPFPNLSSQETVKYKMMGEEIKEKAKVEMKKSDKFRVTCSKTAKIDIIDKKTLRAEKNRKFAKESRERHRKYVQDLEVKVKYLQREVDYYKHRLAKYAILEKYNTSIGYELYDILAKVYKEMQEKNQPLTNIEYFNSIFKRICEEKKEEQTKALKIMTKAMLQVLIPFPKRLAMWFAEKNIQFFNAELLVKLTNSAVSLDQAQTLVDYIRKLHPDENSIKESQLRNLSMARKVKAIAKELIDCQKRIHQEYHKANKHVVMGIPPSCNPELLEICAKIGSSFAFRPEIVNYAMESVNEIEYGVENLSLEKNGDIEMTANSNGTLRKT
jgi:hypothetical protein